MIDIFDEPEIHGAIMDCVRTLDAMATLTDNNRIEISYKRKNGPYMTLTLQQTHELK